MTSAIICCPLWLLEYKGQRVECAFTYLVRTGCGMMYSLCSIVCPCQLFCSAWMCCLEGNLGGFFSLWVSLAS